jgi:RNA polymerase sigma-70 factor, ECF subfamily
MMPRTPEPPSLAERFKRGDRSALPEVCQRYARPMFVTACRMLGDRELAAEAVQQALVHAWRAAGSIDPDRELKPWLYAVTRRAAIDAYRRERRFSRVAPLEDLTGDAEPAVDGPSLDDAWRAWQVRTALETLPLDERRVMFLAHFAGYSQSEIADLLGIALGTVKSRSARAQRRLAAQLGHLNGTPTGPAPLRRVA